MFKANATLFYRYLVSYLLVLSIPIVIIAGYFYASFVAILREEEVSSYYNAVTQTRVQLDERLDEIEKISLQVSLTPMITQLPANAFQLKEELKKYEAVNQLSYEIILYLHGDDRLYSSYSSYTLSTFLNNFYHFEHWDEATFYADLNAIRRPTLYPAEHILRSNAPDDKLITYLIPFPVNSSRPYGTMLFMLKESAFKSMLGSTLAEQDFNAVILDQDNNVVTALAQPAYMQSADWSAFLATPKRDGTAAVLLEGREYVAVSSTSQHTPLSYVFLIPSSVVMDQVSDVQLKMLYMLGLVLLLGFFSIYWLMHVNYDPIKELVKLADRAFAGDKPLTELDAIRTAIDQMAQTTSLLSRQVERSRPLLQEHLISGLLNGKPVTVDELERAPTSRDGQRAGSSHFVVKCIFRWPEAQARPALTDLHADLRDKLPAELNEYGSYIPDDRTLILILSSGQGAEAGAEEHLRILQHYLSVQWNTRVTVGVGNAYTEAPDIAKSFLESSTAADYLLLKGLDGVSRFDQIDFVGSVVHWYPEQHLATLDWYLQHWDVEHIERTLKEMAEKIKGEDIPIYMVKCICFSIMNMLIRRIHQAKTEMPHLRDDFYDLVSLAQFENIDALIEEVMRICREAVHTITLAEQRHDPSLEDKIVAYLDEHFGDPSFTIHSVATHFSLTEAYLRRVFKKQTGLTLSAYVDTLRIRHATQMLEHSDATLSQIVAAIGYLNVSSFIRKFREHTGMTPGEYRVKVRVLETEHHSVAGAIKPRTHPQDTLAQ